MSWSIGLGNKHVFVSRSRDLVWPLDQTPSVGDVEAGGSLRTRSHRHGTLPVCVHLVWVCPGRNKLSCDVVKALYDGQVQRRNAVIGLTVDMGGMAEQHVDKLPVPLLAGDMERSDAFACVGIDIDLLFEQQLYSRDVPSCTEMWSGESPVLVIALGSHCIPRAISSHRGDPPESRDAKDGSPRQWERPCHTPYQEG